MDHEYYPYYFHEPGTEPFRRGENALSAIWDALRRFLAAKPADTKVAPRT